MEIIKNLVQNLISIVILTIFLEMLLPSGIMRRYVKVVMGMVVVVSVLQTASVLMHKDLNLNLPAITNVQSDAEIKKIINSGHKLAEQNQSMALKSYREGIERQVLSIVNLNGKLNALDAEVKFNDEAGSKNYGNLQEIILTVSRSEKNINEGSNLSEVEPVNIQVGEKYAELENGDKGFEQSNSEQIWKLKEIVANFYNLQIDQIEICYK